MSIKGPTRKPRTSDIKAEQGMKKAEDILSKLPPGWGKRGDTTPNID
jgi:hypothetical protein